MFKRKNNILLIFILFFIIAALTSAFIIEHWLGHQPCELCVYERVPYIISILLIIEILFFKKHEKITLLILALLFIGSSVLSFYHFGIEQGFFNELNVCNPDNSNAISKDEILKELTKNNISCKDVSFRVMGLSLATINIIFSIFISAIFINLYRNYGKN